MKTNEYELKLLAEAIALSLKPVKRPRGECDRIEMKPPITKIPKGFRVNITKLWKGIHEK